MRIVYTAEALGDLVSVLEYIAENSELAAADTVVKIRHIEDNIKLFPGAARYDVKTDTYERCILGTRLMIIYHLKGSATIEVIALFHTSRNPETKRNY